MPKKSGRHTPKKNVANYKPATGLAYIPDSKTIAQLWAEARQRLAIYKLTAPHKAKQHLVWRDAPFMINKSSGPAADQ